jgi:Tripartite tricarboxylate transporter TctB family
MRVRDQDFATGILFVVIGALALWIGWDYPRGTAQRPGTGVLPAILSWCMIGTGGLLIIKGAVATGDLMERWAWRPLVAVTSATVLFGLLIDDMGLFVTMIVTMSLCAVGTAETRWFEFAIFLLIIMAGAWAMFIWMLGMPIPVFPVRVPYFISFILR